MTAVLAQIIEATDARPTGHDKYFGHCRHHGSKHNRDLSIRLGQDRIFVHCFAGCEPGDVCESIGIKLRDLFLDNKKSPDEIRRDRERRNKKRVAEEKKRQREGARLDRLREADYLIHSARGIDISNWSDTMLDAALNRLADAYDMLESEEV